MPRTKLDTYNDKYGVYVYTTYPPIKQLSIKGASDNGNIQFNCNRGSSVNVSAKMIDCAANDVIKYEIVRAIRSDNKDIPSGAARGSVNTTTGIYTAATTAQGGAAGDIVAVKAYLEKDPSVFAIAIVRVQ